MYINNNNGKDNNNNNTEDANHTSKIIYIIYSKEKG